MRKTVSRARKKATVCNVESEGKLLSHSCGGNTDAKVTYESTLQTQHPPPAPVLALKVTAPAFRTVSFGDTFRTRAGRQDDEAHQG